MAARSHSCNHSSASNILFETGGDDNVSSAHSCFNKIHWTQKSTFVTLQLPVDSVCWDSYHVITACQVYTLCKLPPAPLFPKTAYITCLLDLWSVCVCTVFVSAIVWSLWRSCSLLEKKLSDIMRSCWCLILLTLLMHHTCSVLCSPETRFTPEWKS